ncbi:probable E3 ubiquitin-protein ligase ZFP1 [Lycium ferocissimum]|uniref:probable E3 ubiquitin-protein ligase ZFP1 n=1 Tax=Lycium ferocissimum TaxID=112874 RepID=UPI0028159D51|nr:probable E3 ubiquitin-protein ligase ZFP1 [Lycium ferocissimum]
MSDTHSSPDNYHIYLGIYPRSQQAYRRIQRITRGPYDHSSGRPHPSSVDHPSSLARLRNNEPYVSRHDQGTITPMNYQSVGSTGFPTVNPIGPIIINVSGRDLVDSLLRTNVADLDDDFDFESLYDTDLENDMDYPDLNEEDVVLGYVKTRTTAPKDGVNNRTKTEEVAHKESAEICPICHVEFEHEQTIGTLRCGHEYHSNCIKQWLLRKKDCPMCRASVLPFTST